MSTIIDEKLVFRKNSSSGVDWKRIEEYVLSIKDTQSVYNVCMTLANILFNTSRALTSNDAYNHGTFYSVGYDTLDAAYYLRDLINQYFRDDIDKMIRDEKYYEGFKKFLKQKLPTFERSNVDKEGFGYGSLVTVINILEKCIEKTRKEES